VIGGIICFLGSEILSSCEERVYKFSIFPENSIEMIEFGACNNGKI